MFILIATNVGPNGLGYHLEFDSIEKAKAHVNLEQPGIVWRQNFDQSWFSSNLEISWYVIKYRNGLGRASRKFK